MTAITGQDISFGFSSDTPLFRALDFSIGAGEMVGIMGKSGTGKSTILNILAGLLPPDSGKVIMPAGEDLYLLSEHERTIFRRAYIGYVFQFFNLLPALSIGENIVLPLMFMGRDENCRERVERLLAEHNIPQGFDDPVVNLSGGELQRIAILRALIHEPRIILADEPTGNVSEIAGAGIMEALRSVLSQGDRTGIIVTHNYRDAAYCDSVYFIHKFAFYGPVRLDDDRRANEERILSHLKELAI